jgi:RNA polymerase sigma-70 factor (ECF subfamily)
MSDGHPDPLRVADRITGVEDAVLLEGLRRHDRDALAAIFDAYGRVAYGLAYRILGRPGDAEDVVQESFLGLWRQASRLDNRRGSVRALLLTIVHRRSIDVLRRRSGRPERALDEAQPFAAETADLVEIAARSQTRERILEALDGLPAEQRSAIELIYFGGLTIAEMAEREKIPLGTAKSRLRLALEKMRRTLATI